MSQIKIYIDEDAMDSDLVAALRSRGVTVITALDAGLVEKSDDEQLAIAAEHGCVLYTFNVSDFYRLHTVSAGAGREHAGMILAPQQRFSVGEQLNFASSRGHHRCADAEPGRVPRQLGLTVGAIASKRGELGLTLGASRRQFGASGRIRTYNPSVNSRTAYSRLALQTQDLYAQKADYRVNWGDSGGTLENATQGGADPKQGQRDRRRLDAKVGFILAI